MEKCIQNIRNEDTFLNFTVEADYCLGDFGVISAYIGEGLAERNTLATDNGQLTTDTQLNLLAQLG